MAGGIGLPTKEDRLSVELTVVVQSVLYIQLHPDMLTAVNFYAGGPKWPLRFSQFLDPSLSLSRFRVKWVFLITPPPPPPPPCGRWLENRYIIKFLMLFCIFTDGRARDNFDTPTPLGSKWRWETNSAKNITHSGIFICDQYSINASQFI